MTMEQSQSRIGLFPAAQNLRDYRYYGVSMTTDAHGHAAWILGGTKIAGILMNNPYEGEAAYVCFSGVAPVKLSATTAPVSVGDRLVAKADGTFEKGNGSLTALYDSTANGIIPALIGAYHALDDLDSETAEHLEVSADFTVSQAYDTYLVDASGGNVEITIPEASDNVGFGFTVKRMDDSANTVTLVPSGTDTLEFDSQIVITAKGVALTLASYSNGWVLV